MHGASNLRMICAQRANLRADGVATTTYGGSGDVGYCVVRPSCDGEKESLRNRDKGGLLDT